MTTLYRPVTITSAEQAEALPIGTRVLHDKRNGDCSVWWIQHRAGNGAGRAPKTMLRSMATATTIPAALRKWRGTLTALLPIEAEEEWGLVQDDEGSMDTYSDEAEVREWARIDGGGTTPVSRYVTPWEEA